MVPIEQPLAAHDMLLRFIGIDTLGAAGPTALIPSRLGGEREAVVGETSPDGSTLEKGGNAETDVSKSPLAADVDGDGKDELNKDREAYYGPRRTAVLVLLILTIVAVLLLIFRWMSVRARRRASKRHSHEMKSRRHSSSSSRKREKSSRTHRQQASMEEIEEAELEGLVRGEGEKDRVRFSDDVDVGR